MHHNIIPYVLYRVKQYNKYAILYAYDVVVDVLLILCIFISSIIYNNIFIYNFSPRTSSMLLFV